MTVDVADGVAGVAVVLVMAVVTCVGSLGGAAEARGTRLATRLATLFFLRGRDLFAGDLTSRTCLTPHCLAISSNVPPTSVGSLLVFQEGLEGLDGGGGGDVVFFVFVLRRDVVRGRARRFGDVLRAVVGFEALGICNQTPLCKTFRNLVVRFRRLRGGVGGSSS